MPRGTQFILEAFSPSRDSYDAEKLKYRRLRGAFKNYSIPGIIKKSSSVITLQKPVPSVQTLKQEINNAYLINASYRLQKAFFPLNKYIWSKVFTRASIRMFGRPLSSEVASLASAEIRRFENAKLLLDNTSDFVDPLLDVYRTLTDEGTAVNRAVDQRYSVLLGDIKQYFETEYAEVFACFDGYPSSGYFNPIDVQLSFTAALQKLQVRNEAWLAWAVEMNDSAHLSVSPEAKRILVGSHRTPVKRRHIKGLFAHEVLVHAQRALNGEAIAKELAEGLPNYLIAEEGLGVLAEAAINQSIPEKIRDRYIDIALALGKRWRRPVSRETLYTICFRRAVVRSILEGREIDLDNLELTTWEHVNRIYRGSLGNKYIGVFTKDIAYYQGFIKIVRYFEAARAEGMLHEKMVYCLQGKFDPTKKQHRRTVRLLTE